MGGEWLSEVQGEQRFEQKQVEQLVEEQQLLAGEQDEGGRVGQRGC